VVNLLKLDPFTRSVWGEFDAVAIAQLEPLLYDPCYRPRLYVTPDSTSNNLFESTPGVAANAQVQYGLQIEPGSIIVGNFLFGLSYTWLTSGTGPVLTYNPFQFLWRMTDVSFDHKLCDDLTPAWFWANAKGDFMNLWDSPYPVTGDGLFNCEFWNQAVNSSGAFIPQIVQVILCVLEPCTPL
jgi:hypothetical protein